MTKRLGVVAIGMVLTVATVGSADVFNMGGTRNTDGTWNGMASLETVPVGDAGNAAERSGSGAGGYGPDRFCGAVNYEYRIGKYEVTAGQYTEFLNKIAGVDTYRLYNPAMSNTSNGCGIARSGGGTVNNPYTYSVASDFINRPVNCVNYWDACRFANWLHNGQPTGAQGAGTTETGAYTLTAEGITYNTITRNAGATWAVTSEDEWYKAAYYKGGGGNAGYFDYPTSSDSEPGNDMTETTNPGNSANYNSSYGVYPIDSGKYTTVVGEFELSHSPSGTFDQGGNVCEWNEAIINSSYRGLRGWSFDLSYYAQDLQASYRSHYYYEPTRESLNIGFRVVEVPEPASMAIIALGGIGILTRRRGGGR